MNILITYATRAGSTAEIAAVIGENLRAQGHQVDVVPIKNAPEPGNYDAVLIGSAIHMGNWLLEAIEYVKVYREHLRRLPVALFTVHMLNRGEDETSRAARAAYLKVVRPLLPQVESVYFTGKMDLARLNLADRLIARLAKAVNEDRRDWEAIRAWQPAFLRNVVQSSSSTIGGALSEQT